MPRRIIPEPVPLDHKWCFKCNSARPRSAYTISRSKLDGLNHCCRTCAKRQRAETAEINAMMASWPAPRPQDTLFTGQFEDSWEAELTDIRLGPMAGKKPPLSS
jgi:hypothetical protein